MCQFCEEEKILLQEDEIVYNVSFGWGDVKIYRNQCVEYTLSVFVDRGYLRLVDLEESGCLDHGEKIKINFCPICGCKLN
jgi:hypothetical protein